MHAQAVTTHPPTKHTYTHTPGAMPSLQCCSMKSHMPVEGFLQRSPSCLLGAMNICSATATPLPALRASCDGGQVGGWVGGCRQRREGRKRSGYRERVSYGRGRSWKRHFSACMPVKCLPAESQCWSDTELPHRQQGSWDGRLGLVDSE